MCPRWLNWLSTCQAPARYLPGCAGRGSSLVLRFSPIVQQSATARLHLACNCKLTTYCHRFTRAAVLHLLILEQSVMIQRIVYVRHCVACQHLHCLTLRPIFTRGSRAARFARGAAALRQRARQRLATFAIRQFGSRGALRARPNATGRLMWRVCPCYGPLFPARAKEKSGTITEPWAQWRGVLSECPAAPRARLTNAHVMLFGVMAPFT